MTEGPTRLTVPAESDLARTIKAASEDTGALVVDTGEALYRLSVDRIDRPVREDRVAATIAGMRTAAGSWRDIDAEAFKAYITERRHASTRPSVRL